MAVDLKSCIETIESGQWFAIRYITADVKKGNGGKVIEIPKARIARRYHPLGTPASVGKAYTPNPDHVSVRVEPDKKPNHNINFTRNIELPNKKLRKLHPILITHINNQPVV